MQWGKVPDNVNNDDFNVQWWKEDRVWQSCLCLCGPIDKLKTDSIYNFHSISNNHQRERFCTFEHRTTCLPIFSLPIMEVKPCHPYQLFCSKSWPWPRNRPKVIKRSINSPFTFDRHSRFLVVTREQTWESVRDKKLRIGTFHLLEELRSVKRNKLPSEGGLMGAEVWHSFKVFGTLQVASLTRQGWGTARWWNLFKNL